MYVQEAGGSRKGFEAAVRVADQLCLFSYN